MRVVEKLNNLDKLDTRLKPDATILRNRTRAKQLAYLPLTTFNTDFKEELD